jgi:hypothetical protein
MIGVGMYVERSPNAELEDDSDMEKVDWETTVGLPWKAQK